MADSNDAVNPETGTPAGDKPSEVDVEKGESVKDVAIVENPLIAQEDEREGWGSKVSYILTLVGYAVGFGNLWRFPYLFHNNGGVAFLIPYVFMLALLGIPMFFLELAIGQRLRKGTLGCWNEISPFLGGIGVTAGFTCVIVGLYYTALIGYCLSYLFDGFRSTLRWQNCSYAVGSADKFCDRPATDKKFMTPAGFNSTYACGLCEKGGASQYYWYHEVLNISDGIEDPGYWNWYLALYVVIGWIMIWAILFKGVKATGKVVYFSALFPYFVLVIFLVYAWTLKGMGNGYRILLDPKWEKLLSGEVWMLAGTQIFFSLGLAFGSLIVFASYLPSNNNCYKDAISVSLINCGTSIFASMVIFPILGAAGTKKFDDCLIENKTKMNLNCSLEKFVRDAGGGQGLIFIAFAEAITLFPVPQIWSFLLFMMLLSLGIDSGFGTVEGGIAVVQDLFKIKDKAKITTIFCAISCVFSMLFCCGWGQYVVTLLDQFVTNWCLLAIAFFECVGISWVYGLKTFAYDIKLMTGRRPNLYLLLCWKIFSPLIMFVLFIASVAEYFTSGQKYEVWNTDNRTNVKVTYPGYVIGIGSLLTIVAIIWIPLFAILNYFKIRVLREEVPAYFPEEELREERNIISDEHEELSHTPLEKALYWQDELRRPSRTASQIVMQADLEGSDTTVNKVASVESAGAGSTGSA